MNLKRSFGLGVICAGLSTGLVAQLPEVESLSKVPAWVTADDRPEPEYQPVFQPEYQPEQRFESSFQSEQSDSTASIGYSDSYSTSPSSQGDAYAAPDAMVSPENSPGSSFNYGAFSNMDNGSGYAPGDEREQVQSVQPAETGGMYAQQPRQPISPASKQDNFSENLDPSNPILSVFRKMETLIQEVQELRGKLEEQNFVIQNLQQSQKDLYLDVDRRLREGGPAKVGALSPLSVVEHDSVNLQAIQGGVDARVASGFGAVEQRAVSAFDFSGGSSSQEEQAQEREVYQKAYQSIQSKDYDAALTGFKSLVKTYPKGQHAPNAHYWMGEIYLLQGELDLAAHSFDEVYQEFPQHLKASDALLKLGYVEYAKGQWIRSRNLLSQVKSRFPNSTSARLADTRLQRMHQEGRI